MGKETWEEPKIIIWKFPARHPHHGSLKYCLGGLLFTSWDLLDNCSILSRITAPESNQIWNEEDQRIPVQILQCSVTAGHLAVREHRAVRQQGNSDSQIQELEESEGMIWESDNDKVKVLKYHLTKLISGCKSFQTLKVKGEKRSYITRNDKIRKYKTD